MYCEIKKILNLPKPETESEGKKICEPENFHSFHNEDLIFHFYYYNINYVHNIQDPVEKPK